MLKRLLVGQDKLQQKQFSSMPINGGIFRVRHTRSSYPYESYSVLTMVSTEMFLLFSSWVISRSNASLRGPWATFTDKLIIPLKSSTKRSASTRCVHCGLGCIQLDWNWKSIVMKAYAPFLIPSSSAAIRYRATSSLFASRKTTRKELPTINNYSLKWSWIAVDI